MESIDRRFIIAAAVLSLILLVAAFALGRATASTSGSAAGAPAVTDETTSTTDGVQGSETSSDSTTTSSTSVPEGAADGDPDAAIPPPLAAAGEIPVYGTEAERDEYVLTLAESGLGIDSRSAVLGAADHICHNLVKLEELRRTPAFATRVVWNESLLELDESDLKAWGVIWRTAPSALCPQTLDYADEVSYWLGF